MGRRQPSHRLFFALQPPQGTLQHIHGIQQGLGGGAGRAVPRRRLHATLLFLGETPTGELERLLDLSEGVSFAPFTLTLDHLGHFPRAAVAWLGARQIPDELHDLVASLRQRVSNAGIGFDTKKFRLHVTLYRNLRTRPAIIPFEPVEWHVKDFVLMESVHTRDGLEYECRGRWPAVRRDI